MGDGTGAVPGSVGDSSPVVDLNWKTVDPEGWLRRHEAAFSAVVGPGLSDDAAARLEKGWRLLHEASLIAERGRRFRRRWPQLPVRVRELVKLKNEMMRRAYEELFGAGTALWKAAQFVRGLLRKLRRHGRSSEHQPYANRPFYVRFERGGHRHAPCFAR